MGKRREDDAKSAEGELPSRSAVSPPVTGRTLPALGAWNATGRGAADLRHRRADFRHAYTAHVTLNELRDWTLLTLGRMNDERRLVPDLVPLPRSGMEFVFSITQEADGGFVGECLSHDIFTQGDTWDRLRTNVKEAVNAFFFCSAEAVHHSSASRA
jgi:hypothetical protein